MTRIAILGAGSWGTGLSVVLSRARKTHEISLWAHNRAQAEALENRRENSTYLAGVRLPDRIRVTHDLATALAAAQVVIGALPSVYARSVYSQALPSITPEMIFVAEREKLEAELIRSEVAAGRMVIPANKVHMKGRLEPMGIGIAARCKVNANIGSEAFIDLGCDDWRLARTRQHKHVGL